MSVRPSVAFNPLPYYLTASGFDPGAVPLAEAYRQIRAAGFDAVHIEVPSSGTTADYRRLLADHGLAPAPGYFQAPLADAISRAETLESARRTAAQHADLGLDRIFVADQFGPAQRQSRPAVGDSFDADRLERVVEGLAEVCGAMVAEGVTPCLHQHVGTWIETPEETVAVLDAIAPELLLFGPDTGHLSWVGADPAVFIGRYLDRVGAVHLKDFRRAIAREGLALAHDYASITGDHVWTEPGRGDVDFDAVLDVLAGFDGWYVIEVDIADQPTVLDTARVSAQWVHERLG